VITTPVRFEAAELQRAYQKQVIKMSTYWSSDCWNAHISLCRRQKEPKGQPSHLQSQQDLFI